MNETQFARSVCQHLDRGTDQISFRAQQRLAAARQAALDRLPADPAPAVHAGMAALPVRGVGFGSARAPRAEERPASLWWRLAVTAAPAVLLALGLMTATSLEEEQSVEDLAEIDSALLTDELPLVAYADHGFGVYLQNTRR